MKTIESPCGNTTTLPGDEVPMVLHLTDAAKTKVGELLAGQPTVVAVRIAVQSGGCSGFKYVFGLDSEFGEDDFGFEANGRFVVIDSISLDLLKGSTLDYLKEIGSEHFDIRNPALKSKCGCGESFAL